MKKIFSIGLFLILMTAIISNTSPLSVQASTAKTTAQPKVVAKVMAKPVVKAKTAKPTVKPKVIAKTTSKFKTTLKWDASALKILSNSAGFDYSSAVRNAYIKKVENYAKRNNIKTITAAVINNMRE